MRSRLGIAAAATAASLGAWAHLASAQAPEEPEDLVEVFYPNGACQSRWIEVETFDRETRVWLPHAHHPHVRGDSCQMEDAGTLLNELRMRCFDPEGVRLPSAWTIGVDVFGTPGPHVCDGDPAALAEPG